MARSVRAITKIARWTSGATFLAVALSVGALAILHHARAPIAPSAVEAAAGAWVPKGARMTEETMQVNRAKSLHGGGLRVTAVQVTWVEQGASTAHLAGRLAATTKRAGWILMERSPGRLVSESFAEVPAKGASFLEPMDVWKVSVRELSPLRWSVQLRLSEDAIRASDSRTFGMSSLPILGKLLETKSAFGR